MLWRGKPKAGYGVMARRARALLAAALGCAALATGSAAVAAEADNGAMQDAVSAAGRAAGRGKRKNARYGGHRRRCRRWAAGVA